MNYFAVQVSYCYLKVITCSAYDSHNFRTYIHTHTYTEAINTKQNRILNEIHCGKSFPDYYYLKLSFAAFVCIVCHITNGNVSNTHTLPDYLQIHWKSFTYICHTLSVCKFLS